MKKFILIILLIIEIGNSYSQIRLVEVDPIIDFVSIKNFGVSTVDISSYRLCALIVYTPPGGLSALNLESGSLNLAPGQTVTVSGWSLATNSDLGLYLPSGGFHLPANMVDFTQWGAGGLGRESVAVSKGIWTAGDFIAGDPPFNYSGDGTQNGLDFWQPVLSTETDILSYSLAGQTGEAIIDDVNHTVDLEVEFGTEVTSLIPSFILSEEATAQVSAVDQESGVTANDFSNPVIYTVTAGNQTTTQDWLITVTIAPNTEADILTYSFTEQTGPATIGDGTVDIEVAMGTNVTNLVATFTLSENASVTILSAPQESGVTANDFSNPVTYIVTAEDGTTKNWVVSITVDVPPNTETDFLSFSLNEQTGPAVINTINQTVLIEVANGTNVMSLVASFTLSDGASAEISSTIQQSGITINDFSNPVIYHITAEDGVTFQDWTVNITLALNDDTDILTFSFSEQTKSAAINLADHTVDLEVEPGTDITGLIADFELSSGAVAVVNSVMQLSGSSTNNFTNPVIYSITAEDGITNQDWIVTVIFDPQTDFVSFSFPEETGFKEINTEDHTIMVEVQFGTDLSALTASFTLSDGAVAEIDGTQQVNGQTVNDFNDPITYSIISSGGINVQNWVVTLTFGPSFETEFLTYSLEEQIGQATINSNDHTINVEVSFDTDLTALTSTFALSQGAIATVNSLEQESAVTTNDFSEPVVYLITAEDGETIQEWIVTVTLGPNSANDFIFFSLPEETGPAVINYVNHIIDIEVAFGTDLGSLVASFTLSEGASTSVGGILQESGVSDNDFTTALIYTVTAEDGTTVQDWSVCTVLAPNSEANILNFSFTDETGPAQIDDTSSEVIVEVHSEADIVNLIATFTLSEGARAEVNGLIQESGISSNDFSAPTIYKILAEDGITIRDWTIIVNQQAITDLKELAITGQLSLYPNPASEYLLLRLENDYHGPVSLTLKDIDGRELRSLIYLKRSEYFEGSISISEYKNPLIIAEIIFEDQRILHRVVKK